MSLHGGLHVRARAAGLALVWLLGWWSALRETARADAPRPLSYDVRIDAPLLVAGATAWVVSEAMKEQLAPARCRLCGDNAFDGAIHDAVLWSREQPAHRLSDALLFGIVPAAAFVSAVYPAPRHRSPMVLFTDLLMLGEALVLTADLTQLTKFWVGRQRPYAYGAGAEQGQLSHGRDDNLSFFSGHTSITFTLASAAGTTATLRGYEHAPIVWAVGMPLAALTGYLRMAADRHYFTDVLTGALVGSAIGVLVPWLHTLGQRGKVPAISLGPSNMLLLSWAR